MKIANAYKVGLSIMVISTVLALVSTGLHNSCPRACTDPLPNQISYYALVLSLVGFVVSLLITVYLFITKDTDKGKRLAGLFVVLFAISCIFFYLGVECTHICPKIVHELMSAFTHPFGWENGESGYGNQAQVGCSLF